MVDEKLTGLTENTAPVATDLLLMTDDPAGTPLSQRITFANLAKGFTVEDIGDVTLTSVATGDVLEWDGSKWINAVPLSNVSSANADIAVATGSTTPVLTLNSGTSASQIVKLDGSAKLPAVDGSALINLPSSGAIVLHDAQVTSGTGDKDIPLSDETKVRLKVFVKFTSGTNTINRWKVNGESAFQNNHNEVNGSTSGGGSGTGSIVDTVRAYGAGGSAIIDFWIEDGNVFSSWLGHMASQGTAFGGGRTTSGTHTAIDELTLQAFSGVTYFIKVLGYDD